jgi:hypothetical protein
MLEFFHSLIVRRPLQVSPGVDCVYTTTTTHFISNLVMSACFIERFKLAAMSHLIFNKVKCRIPVPVRATVLEIVFVGLKEQVRVDQVAISPENAHVQSLSFR